MFGISKHTFQSMVRDGEKRRVPDQAFFLKAMLRTSKDTLARFWAGLQERVMRHWARFKTRNTGSSILAIASIRTLETYLESRQNCLNCSISRSVALMSPAPASRGSKIESDEKKRLEYCWDTHSTLTDFLQFFILIPLRLGFVLLVPLFLLGVVSIHHLLIWCLYKINE